MKSIFDPITLGPIELKSRLVRSATMEHAERPDGTLCKEELQNVYLELVKGGVGLIITGMMAVGFRARPNTGMARLYHDDTLNGLKEIIAAVHSAGGKIVIQLGQCGAKAAVMEDGGHGYAPSDMEYIQGHPAMEMNFAQMARVKEEFASAAARCQAIGADGVQIHMAHGYLLSEFLSPWFNKRSDAYGGSIENRARFPLEVAKAVVERCGKDYPVLVKINGEDGTEPGLTAEESRFVCKGLEKLGIAAIEVSVGISVNATSRAVRPVPNTSAENYTAGNAGSLAECIEIPVISVGGFRDLDRIENLLNQSKIEAISMCRPLICEPQLLNRWKAHQTARARCVSCGKCARLPDFGCTTFRLQQG